MEAGNILKNETGLPIVKLASMIGKGSYGEVWKGVHLTGGGRDVVVKVGLWEDDGDIEKEGKILTNMQHDHIVRCYETFTDTRKRRYLVMAHAEHGDLRAVMRKKMQTREDKADIFEPLTTKLLEYAGGRCTDHDSVATEALQALHGLSREAWERLSPYIQQVEDFVEMPNIKTGEDLLQSLQLACPYGIYDRAFSSEQIIWKALHQVLRGLEYAHAMGVIHRDMKLDNMLYTARSDVLLSDFGIAMQNKTKLQDGIAGGTQCPPGSVPYLPPEVVDGIVGPETDIWSVGIMFHEICLCRHPVVPHRDARRDPPARLLSKVMDAKGLYSLVKLKKLGLIKNLSTDLCSVVDAMLTTNHKFRPSAKKLLGMPAFCKRLVMSWEQASSLEEIDKLSSYLSTYYGFPHIPQRDLLKPTTLPMVRRHFNHLSRDNHTLRKSTAKILATAEGTTFTLG